MANRWGMSKDDKVMRVCNSSMIAFGALCVMLGICIEIAGVADGRPDESLWPASVIAVSGGTLIGMALSSLRRKEDK